jgi:hypothetical protein
MLRMGADENFDNDILRGMLRRAPDLDVRRVQDAGLTGADDPTVLAWAADEERILLTHDVTTLTHYAQLRIAAGQRVPGVFAVAQTALTGTVVEDLLLL